MVKWKCSKWQFYGLNSPVLWRTWHTYAPVVPADELWLWPVDLVTMETMSLGAGVVFKVSGISEVGWVEEGGVGMEETGWGEGTGGNSPVVTYGGESEQLFRVIF